MQLKYTPWAALLLFLSGVLSAAHAETLKGWVEPAEIVRLAPGVSGRVESVSVSVGDRVLKGTRLLTMDQTAHKADLAAAESKREAAGAEYEEVNRAFDRDQQLYDEGSLSAVALELRRIERLHRLADLRRADAAVAQAHNQLSLGQIDAPIDGTIVGNDLAAGSFVHPDEARPRTIRLAGFASQVRIVADPQTATLPGLGQGVSLSHGGVTQNGQVKGYDGDAVPGMVSLTISADGDLPTPGTSIDVIVGE